jgi:hypothetical protein
MQFLGSLTMARIQTALLVIALQIVLLEATYGHDIKGLILELNSSSSPSIKSALAQIPTADFNTRSVLNNLRLWPVPRKLTICFHSGSASLRKRVTESMRRIWPLAILTEGRLDFDQMSFNDPPDCGQDPKVDIRVDFKDGEGYQSYVGVESRLHNPSMNLQGFTETSPTGAEFDRLVGHETGHAIGLEHEHQSPAAPKCNWNFDYIWTAYSWKSKEEMYDNFMKLQDYILKGSHAYIFSTYDPKSAMHYAFKPSAFNDREKDPCFIAQNYVPSDQDRSAIRVAYGSNVVAIQTRMKGLLPEIAKSIAADDFAKLQPLLKMKADLLNE